jgi:hypothetical protein
LQPEGTISDLVRRIASPRSSFLMILLMGGGAWPFLAVAVVVLKLVLESSIGDLNSLATTKINDCFKPIVVVPRGGSSGG